jgi:glycosyltransferase involved in cell wall biosynthesis
MYFAAADVCVFPYKDIFNSGSVILAMTFGKPFVAPQKGAIPSIAPEGNILYENLNEGLTEAGTVSDETLANVGDVNRQAALTNHDWDDIADRTRQIYRSKDSNQ